MEIKNLPKYFSLDTRNRESSSTHERPTFSGMYYNSDDNVVSLTSISMPVVYNITTEISQITYNDYEHAGGAVDRIIDIPIGSYNLREFCGMFQAILNEVATRNAIAQSNMFKLVVEEYKEYISDIGPQFQSNSNPPANLEEYTTGRIVIYTKQTQDNNNILINITQVGDPIATIKIHEKLAKILGFTNLVDNTINILYTGIADFDYSYIGPVPANMSYYTDTIHVQMDNIVSSFESPKIPNIIATINNNNSFSYNNIQTPYIEFYSGRISNPKLGSIKLKFLDVEGNLINTYGAHIKLTLVSFKDTEENKESVIRARK